MFYWTTQIVVTWEWLLKRHRALSDVVKTLSKRDQLLKKKKIAKRTLNWIWVRYESWLTKYFPSFILYWLWPQSYFISFRIFIILCWHGFCTHLSRGLRWKTFKRSKKCSKIHNFVFLIKLIGTWKILLSTCSQFKCDRFWIFFNHTGLDISLALFHERAISLVENWTLRVWLWPHIKCISSIRA